MEKVKCPNCEADNLSNSKYCSRCGHALPARVIETPVENIVAKTAQPEKKKKILVSILSVLAFFISYYAVQHIFFKTPTFDKAMMEVASELNKSCPIMVDQETRLDNVAAIPGNTFQYNYTLINVQSSQVNADTVRKYLEPNIINTVKTNPDLKTFRDNKTTMSYNYKDQNGIFILKIDITPEMYQ